MWTEKSLFRLGGCPGWSESSLGAQIILLVLSCCVSLGLQILDLCPDKRIHHSYLTSVSCLDAFQMSKHSTVLKKKYFNLLINCKSRWTKVFVTLWCHSLIKLMHFQIYLKFIVAKLWQLPSCKFHQMKAKWFPQEKLCYKKFDFFAIFLYQQFFIKGKL